MRILSAAVFMTTMAVTLAASARPSAAVVIYPWCADYSGRGGYGSGNCVVYFIEPMPSDTRWQWRLLQSESALSTLSAAAHTFAAHTAVNLISSAGAVRPTPRSRS
jgi:hypothetical protein